MNLTNELEEEMKKLYVEHSENFILGYMKNQLKNPANLSQFLGKRNNPYDRNWDAYMHI